jgi:hypothetical protein
VNDNPNPIWYRGTITLSNDRRTQIGGFIAFERDGWLTMHPHGHQPDNYRLMYPLTSITSILQSDTPATPRELMYAYIIPWEE